MGKRFCELMIILFVFCGIFAASPAVNAMMKSTGIVRSGLSSVTVKKDGDKLNIQWQYDALVQNKSLEGTKVKIILYQNGQFIRTIAENVSIGQNGRGSWDWGNKIGTWNDFFVKEKVFVKGKEYTLEIVSMANPNVRIMSNKMWCEEDCGKVVMPAGINE